MLEKYFSKNSFTRLKGTTVQNSNLTLLTAFAIVRFIRARA